MRVGKTIEERAFRPNDVPDDYFYYFPAFIVMSMMNVDLNHVRKILDYGHRMSMLVAGHLFKQVTFDT